MKPGLHTFKVLRLVTVSVYRRRQRGRRIDRDRERKTFISKKREERMEGEVVDSVSLFNYFKFQSFFFLPFPFLRRGQLNGHQVDHHLM